MLVASGSFVPSIFPNDAARKLHGDGEMLNGYERSNCVELLPADVPFLPTPLDLKRKKRKEKKKSHDHLFAFLSCTQFRSAQGKIKLQLHCELVFT